MVECRHYKAAKLREKGCKVTETDWYCMLAFLLFLLVLHVAKVGL